MIKKVLYLLTTTLILASCASTQDSRSQSQAGVTSTLTIDGKTEKLSHVFARRIETDRDGEAIAVFLSNKPLPVTELVIQLKDFSPFANESDFLNDSSINGLFFLIKKEEPFQNTLVGFERFVIKAGRLYEAPVMVGEWFKEFSLVQGRIAARSDGPEFVPDDYEPENGLKYSYTARFEADLQGRSVCEAFQGSPSAGEGAVFSEPGTAQGTVVINGKMIKLEYAYALRKKIFFDEPDELIEVVITGRPYEAEEIASLLEMNPSTRPLLGMVLQFSNNPIVSAVVRLHRAEGPFETWMHTAGTVADRAEAKDFQITKDRISGKSRGSGEGFGDKWSYSVSVDVPFKR